MPSTGLTRFPTTALVGETWSRVSRFSVIGLAYAGPITSTVLLAWVAVDWNRRWIFITVAIGLLVFDTIVTTTNKRSYRSLALELANTRSALEQAQENNVRQQNDIEATEGALQLILNSLVRELAVALNFRTPNDRISVYFNNGSRFVMAARYSADPVFHTAKEDAYLVSRSLISSAWRNQIASTKYPNVEEWRSALAQDLGHSPGIGETIHMTSLSAAGVRLEFHNDNVGVLVIESTDSERAKQRTANLMQKNAAGVLIAELLRNHSARVPSLR
ncbi:hypothetical protein M2390_002990 [Mycetocola sp. BIGb0189]|uniref:hypothetical protein n=1 Tax=Mycetocola sp. BIGb0189 TaxID=2940604 RepID=UPI0021677FFF|nr:hypothetical protein [Mycetocola sp. BIGb0189]MCS4277775.1 hypothetical protein [Mycetocola sp. BIGb0189]